MGKKYNHVTNRLKDLRNMIARIEKQGGDATTEKRLYSQTIMKCNARLTTDENVLRRRDQIFEEIIAGMDRDSINWNPVGVSPT